MPVKSIPVQAGIQSLQNRLPQKGRVELITVRPQKRAAVEVLEQVNVGTNGLEGDHYNGRSGKRSVTLIQAEHISAIASMLQTDEVDPLLLRRNIVVSGINLLALKGREFRIGTAVLQMTGLCHPCSRMEEVLGAGGYNVMRGHGGINATVISPGLIKRLDRVEVFYPEAGY